MPYDGQTIVDIDITRPDGDAEPKSILDDVTKETKRVLKNTPYSWSRFQNISGSDMVLGDVVSLGGTNGLVVADTINSYMKYVVLVEDIASGAVGLVARNGGPVSAKTAGAVVAYNYVRKSVTSKSLEDMGIAVAAATIVPSGSIGFALESVASAGLCSVFLFEHTSASPTDTTNHVLTMTNRTGVVVGIGAAASPDPANDNSTILNDVKGTLRPLVFAYESIPNITQGKWVVDGIHPVLVQGPVTRLHYLRKSATTMALESTGVSATTIAARPPGTVGIAVSELVSSGVSLVQALLFGLTSDVPAMSLPQVVNVNGQFVNALTRSYTGQRAALFNPLDGSTIVLPMPSTYTNDTNIQGRNGRDQANLFNPNTYTYFYLTYDGLTLATRSSNNAPGVGPNLADGETHFAFLDVIRRDGSANLMNVITVGQWSYYKTPVTVGVISVLNTETVMNIAGAVPPDAGEFDIDGYGTANKPGAAQASIYDFDVRIITTIPFRKSRLGVTGVSDANTKSDGLQLTGRVPNTGFLAGMWTEVSNPSATSVTLSATVNIVGYKNPV